MDQSDLDFRAELDVGTYAQDDHSDDQRTRDVHGLVGGYHLFLYGCRNAYLCRSSCFLVRDQRYRLLGPSVTRKLEP